jgi:transposase
MTSDEDIWVEADDPLDSGVKLPQHVINAWKKEQAVTDWRTGMTLRNVAAKYDVSRETVRDWTNGLARLAGASRRPRRPVLEKVEAAQ